MGRYYHAAPASCAEKIQQLLPMSLDEQLASIEVATLAAAVAD
jgi:hypothetical protein